MSVSEPIWEVAPGTLVLEPDEVHIWRIGLDRPTTVVADLERVLAADERDRANRLVFPRGRERFIVGRGMVRTVLGQYLGRAPESLAFRYGPHGKPALAAGDWEFNLAHSAELALLAVGRGRRIGIDVEAVRALGDADPIVARYFSEAERAAYFRLPKSRREDAFFQVWTRKEAFIKATGEGLFRALARFDVSVDPDEAPRLLRVADEPDEAGRWVLRNLDPGPGFRATVAVEGPSFRLRCFDVLDGWPPAPLG